MVVLAERAVEKNLPGCARFCFIIAVSWCKGRLDALPSWQAYRLTPASSIPK
jgi:hypothetical protein